MKKRLDIALIDRGFATGRDKAKALIMTGNVFVNGQRFDKAGEDVSDDDVIEVRGEQLRYVSRGGLKLEKALDAFKISLEGKRCCDFGASTGGFTDCMLQNGAEHVYAFDVGYGQLAWKLRQSNQVTNFERKNVRYLTVEEIGCQVDFITVDVSFISLSLILPVVERFLKDDALCVCLIKPQFEAGRENVEKKGVVKDPKVHVEVIAKIINFAENSGFLIKGLDFSPVKGPEGNIEYLLFIQKGLNIEPFMQQNILAVVEDAHNQLTRKA